ncbi:molybdate ABC transporter substrate-binding protein [Dielma fastidiosa]|uniref:Molybdate transport system substrate-binding protein n=1 Tax=Dielma fastidiosa TaxID=1034346 RepID=A0A318KLS6_9FIRM|nr:molybdate ABC transporter substrate-binding protein [Dielma fastidiosa]PXX77362.1 molybdate transport system substrate-binding protein [Dielma fastidiosa]
MKKLWMGLLAGMLCLSACTANPAPNEDENNAAKPTELLISAAASMTDCLTELAELYKAAAPNVTLTFTFGSSGSLQSQIEEGAPADVFISAAQKQMNALDEKDLIDKDTRKDLLVNEVVLITPKGNPLGLSSFTDVTKDEVAKIALGELGSVPVGQYSEEIFKHYEIMDAVSAKAVYGSDVRTVLTWIENGEADCGVVYATDAAISDAVDVAAVAPAESHKEVVYPIAMIKDSKQPEAAKAFIDYCFSEEAAAIFTKYGFALAK